MESGHEVQRDITGSDAFSQDSSKRFLIKSYQDSDVKLGDFVEVIAIYTRMPESAVPGTAYINILIFILQSYRSFSSDDHIC